MTLLELYKLCNDALTHGTPSDAIVRAWDADVNYYMPVTGVVTSPEDNTIDLQTDDPS